MNVADSVEYIKDLIRTVPDFPKPGINFFDITTVLSDPKGLKLTCELMAKPWLDKKIDAVVGTESRGFIFAVPIAQILGCGFIPIRKPGKLPSKTISAEYDLEYGSDKLEIHVDAIKPGDNILLIDDLLATGGTIKACIQLVEQLGGKVAGLGFLIELAFLNPRAKLEGYNVNSIISYEKD
ncbi:MAG: adenine phosphoribosyltransferase [Phycisphaerae bacterium]|nr:adenine phosphoribosyltransferase [Phycisphaerae bacterium]